MKQIFSGTILNETSGIGTNFSVSTDVAKAKAALLRACETVANQLTESIMKEDEEKS